MNDRPHQEALRPRPGLGLGTFVFSWLPIAPVAIETAGTPAVLCRMLPDRPGGLR